MELSNWGAIKNSVEKLLSEEISLGSQLRQGRNSQVHVIKTKGKDFVLKLYFQPHRLGTEFSAYEELRRNGFLNLPYPVAQDSTLQLGVYEKIEGHIPEKLSERILFIKESVQLLKNLKNLSLKIPVPSFQNAAEACFSLSDLWKNIEGRCENLRQATKGVHPEAHDFLQVLEAKFGDIRKKQESRPSELTQEDRTLSPSDFGTHNALIHNDQIYFLDFEYFGWDDPAKTLSDGLLHPGMNLSKGEGQIFMSEFQEHFPQSEKVMARFPLVYPLYILKWSLILMNEFKNQDWARRQFAGNSSTREELLHAQLQKAKNMFVRLEETL